MREKLIKLLNEVQDYGTKSTYEERSITVESKDNKTIANFLVVNGVTIPVRCKDCKISFYNPFFTDDGKQLICRKWAKWNIVNEDDFCSYGERRTNVEAIY